MSELDTMRGAIDEIDNQIVHLFERRMAITQRVVYWTTFGKKKFWRAKRLFCGIHL